LPQLPDSGFDHVASFYDPLARLVFRDAQLRAQMVLLPFIEDNTRVLIAGGGSGWLLQQLLNTGKQLHILYLDASPKMIEMAERRNRQQLTQSYASVEFRVGTEQAILPAETFDYIVTPFLLDLFPERRLEKLMRRLNQAMAQNGKWLFADFWPARQPAPWWQKLLLKAMYIFFGLLSNVEAGHLPNFNHHFATLELKESYSANFYRGMIQAKVFSRQMV